MSRSAEILNLSYLLDQEKDEILAVLKRDDNLKKIEDKRVRRLKNELLEIKKKGARIHRLRQNSAKICVRCQRSLGLIFNRGDICRDCQLSVCKACRVVIKDNVWKCTVCAKIMEIRITTGDWFFEERAKRFKNSTILGSDVVRKSLMRKTAGPGKSDGGSKMPSNYKLPAVSENAEDSGKRTPDKQSGKPEDAKSLHSNYDTQSLRSNRSVPRSNGHYMRENFYAMCEVSFPILYKCMFEVHKLEQPAFFSTPDKQSGKPEDAKSLHSNYDTQSLRSNRSVPRSNGLDKRIRKQSRTGEDAISIYSNHDTQSLRSASSIPRSERTPKSDIHGFTDSSLAGQESGEVISQACLKIDSRPESKHSSPVSIRGSVHSVDISTQQSTTVTVHQSSPTPSKRSQTSNYSHKIAAGGMKASTSIPEHIGNAHRRRGSGTPSITLSRASVASDRSRSELDLSGHFAEDNGETGSIRSKSKSVPGDLNTDLEYLDETEEEFPERLGHKTASIKSGYSMNAQPDKKWTHLCVADADADTTSINSMTSVYSETGDYGNIKVTGEILLNINYSYKTGALNVLVKSCRNLAIADERKNRTDPYVKAYLLPDKSRQNKRKTKIKTNTTNPEFNEILKYVISHTQLETRTLHLSVWHNDRFGRNSFLGEINIPLDTGNFENQEDQSFYLQPKMDIASDVTLQYKGELAIGLRYIPPEKNLTLPLEPITTGKKSFRKSKKIPMPTGGILEVLIKEAKNLTAVKSGGTSDTFVKGYLLPDNNKSTKHKTPIVKKSVNPQWNFTFSFTSLQPNDLQNVCLELTVWDKESLSSNVFLGGVCLNCGSGTSYGNEVDWMDAQGEEQYLWQKMLDNPGTLVEGTLMLRSTMAKHKKAS
ncbi:synaptotagmin-like protein 5 [Gastrophryne carolinensis]